VVVAIVIGALLWSGLQQATRRVLVANGIAAPALMALQIVFLHMDHLG
jgi:hypothetical protein